MTGTVGVPWRAKNARCARITAKSKKKRGRPQEGMSCQNVVQKKDLLEKNGIAGSRIVMEKLRPIMRAKEPARMGAVLEGVLPKKLRV
jgi:hypothetical protein